MASFIKSIHNNILIKFAQILARDESIVAHINQFNSQFTGIENR